MLVSHNVYPFLDAIVWLFDVWMPDDGYDETLIPVDFQKAGQIIDDDLFKILITPLPRGGKNTIDM